MIHYNYYYILLASCFGVCIVSNIHVHASPIAENSIQNVPVVTAEEIDPEYPSSSKGGPGFPFAFAPFFQSNKPTTSGNAVVAGEVQGIYAINNSTLISVSDPGNPKPAVAQLTSEAIYAAQPVNTTETVDLEDGSTIINTLAGFNVFAAENTQAYAEGDHITFINHGQSFASGIGESNADANTTNPGTTPGTGWSKN